MSTMIDLTDRIAENLRAVQDRIAAAARAADRDPSEVTLVAVGKTHDASYIEAALQAGHGVFGENRVQEAKAKFPPLRADHPDLVLHLIGPLQTNKVRDALQTFDVIETLDREKLAKAVAKEADKLGTAPPCFVQVNTGAEPQKAGIAPDDVDGFVALCRDSLSLPVEGLMCIPPIDEPPAPHFAFLRELAVRNGLAKLSMGMSADYETAIRLGATHVRVGTAIFGPRPPRHDT